jgi:hypothetical protein
MVSSLRSIGLIEYRPGRRVVALPVLFLDLAFLTSRSTTFAGDNVVVEPIVDKLLSMEPGDEQLTITKTATETEAATKHVNSRPRTPADLLELDYVFGQRGLLTVDEFQKEAERRGVQLRVGHLEALHRSGQLVPTFRIRLRRREIVEGLHTDTSLEGLRRLDRRGRLHVVGQEPFRSWSKDRVRVNGGSVWLDVYLYSPWQLLLLWEASIALPTMRPSGRGAFGRRFRIVDPPWSTVPVTKEMLVALSALEPVYYPHIVGSVHYSGSPARPGDWFDRYAKWMGDRKPDQLIAWLQLTADDIEKFGDTLILRARFFDPIQDWVDLVRLMAPEKWEKATGPVRLALEHHIASEVLFRLRDELALAGAAAPLPAPPSFAWVPQHDRFNHPAEQLDEVLTDFGISPHPSLVVALEGQVEMIMAGNSMDHLHVPSRRNYIELFNVGGVDKNYGLLGGYVAAPELGKALPPDMVLLNRPVTRFMVVADPEKELRTQAGRDKKKGQIVTSMMGRLAPTYQTPQVRTQLETMVAMETWNGTDSFEFAHFTDDEIVAGIKSAYALAGRPEPSVLVADVATLRNRRGNLRALLRRLPAPVIGKDKLAEAMWPTLRSRLDQHLQAGTLDQVPIARILRRAVDLATTSLRRSTALKV